MDLYEDGWYEVEEYDTLRLVVWYPADTPGNGIVVDAEFIGEGVR